MPGTFTVRMAWDSYRLADACIANTPWEAHLMNYLFAAPTERVHVVPNGVEDVFFSSAPVKRGPWLVCSATITVRKRVVELAQAAVKAKTPVWIIGRPYSETDPYAREFFALAKNFPDYVRFEGPISDRARLAAAYREARGFVLLSTMETRSLSAEEAAACQCPLLLSDLPWARSTFGDTAMYCAIDNVESTARRLREFYDAAPALPTPAPPMRWLEVGHAFRRIYEAVSKDPSSTPRLSEGTDRGKK